MHVADAKPRASSCEQLFTVRCEPRNGPAYPC